VTAVELNANGDTRGRILDAAEALFVEHGFEATSMRTITATAGVNLAAVNYHFGSKEALIQEVFRRRLTWLNRERLRALDAFESEAQGAALKPSQIVEAFFGTALRLAADVQHGGHRFMRLLGRTYTDPARFVRTFLAEEYADVVDRFSVALFRALPDVPREEILWRFHFMLGYGVCAGGHGCAADHGRQGGRGRSPGGRAAIDVFSVGRVARAAARDGQQERGSGESSGAAQHAPQSGVIPPGRRRRCRRRCDGVGTDAVHK